MLAGGIGTRLAEPAHALDIGVAQDGKHRVAAGCGRIGRLSHGSTVPPRSCTLKGFLDPFGNEPDR